MSIEEALGKLTPEEQVNLLKRRLQRSEKARLDAEALLERRARELDRINRELLEREEVLQSRLELGNRELLAAQRTARIATVFRPRGGKFIYSPELRQILGLPSGCDLNPELLQTRIHRLDRKRVATDEIKFYTEMPTDIDHIYEHRIIRPVDQEVRWIRWTLRRETDDRGRFQSVFGTVQDITLQRHTERHARALSLIAGRRVKTLSKLSDELALSHAEAEEANRSKSQFLAMMSHDIRTPMNGILGLLETLSHSDLDDAQRHKLNLARSSGLQLNILLNDIIEFVRAETGKIELQPEAVDLHMALGNIVEFWQVANPNPNVVLTSRIDPDIPKTVLVDPTRFRQLIDNLVSNALKYTPGGTVQVIAQNKGATLRIEVEDDGPGIREELQRRLFTDFTRLRTMTAGSGYSAGLGLAICKRLVRAMEGTIGVVSEVGKGSRFWFEIPLVRILSFDRTGHVPRQPVASPPVKLAAHVLIAEDIATNRQVLASMLELTGCTFEFAEDGREAIVAVQNGDFDIILMDVNMPLLDGKEATRLIRQLPGAKGQVPVVGVTAHVMQSDHDELLEAGMNALVSKPVDLASLTARMEEVLRQSAGTAADPATIPLIDEEATRQLFDALPEDRRNTVLALSLRDMASLGKKLSAAIRSGDHGKARREAHSLRGVGGNIGAMRLASLLAEGAQIDAGVLDQVVTDTIADIRHRFSVE
ncbi:ATP-binding protein [Alteraurantiacibacter aestuarii]|uniref:histidine kinase n=1 Tax=Alteraurantiacibacter aestuarii TaxID=650004 RepID=A0A844ZNY4_9SPHN|nr:response regulator [Alteraurantiacibacter aestuarii]